METNRGKPREACGISGIYAPGEQVARLAFFAQYALQHRGQESAGIVTSDGRQFLPGKTEGLLRLASVGPEGLDALQRQQKQRHQRKNRQPQPQNL